MEKTKTAFTRILQLNVCNLIGRYKRSAVHITSYISDEERQFVRM